MAESSLPDPPDLPPGELQAQEHAHTATDHERTDVDVRQIGLFGAGLVLLAIVIHFALGAMMQAYSAQQFALVGKGAPSAPILWSSTEPRLQVDPADELRKLRADEDARLHSYGWVDRDRGVVRLPIERALEIMAKRGLPTREQKRETTRNEKQKPKDEN